MPVIKMFRPGFALFDLTIVARQAVNPVRGSAAASMLDRCVGASSSSLASIVTVSLSVPRGLLFVPPRMAYPFGDSGPSGSSCHPDPGLMMTLLPFH